MTISFDGTKLRSYFVKTLLVSLVVAAGAGIFTLLAGTFDVIEARILLTTLMVGVYSVISLCCMTVFGGRFAVWGLTGIGLATLSLLLGLAAVWVAFDVDWDQFGQLLKYFAIFGISAIAVGHQSLLLRLMGHATSSAKALISGTNLVIGVVAAMLILPLLLENFELSEAYWRLVGVCAILDVLGTIVSSVLARPTSRR